MFPAVLPFRLRLQDSSFFYIHHTISCGAFYFSIYTWQRYGWLCAYLSSPDHIMLGEANGLGGSPQLSLHAFDNGTWTCE